MNYLIDTNVFFEVLMYIGGRPIPNSGIDCQKIMQGNCYISELTEIEIISVIGKYARGRSETMEKCSREYITDRNERCLCMRQYSVPRVKKWPKKRTSAMLKLIKDILQGNSDAWKVTVLPISQHMVDNAKVFIYRAMKYNFGSVDALIAGTQMEYVQKNMGIVTKDKGFIAALKEAGLAVHGFELVS